LRRDNLRCLDLKVFAEPLRDQVCDRALLRARTAVLSFKHLERREFCAEHRAAEALHKCVDTPGLVHVLSAMEAWQTVKPWHDNSRGQTGLRPAAGRCLRCYACFLHMWMGLAYGGVWPWLPF
jgi:hypothetical protein